MTAQPFKIAIVNTFDITDATMWSGTPLHIYLKIAEVYGKENIDLFSIPFKRNWASLARGLYFNRVKKQNYLSDFDPAVVASSYNDFKKVREGGYEVIITFQFFMVPNIYNGRSKIIFWSDATFNNLLNFYSYVSNVPDYTVKEAHRLQKQALQQSDAIILSSEWAARSAINDYGAEPEKVDIISFASNFNAIPSAGEVEAIIASRSAQPLKLLFIGVDWGRKGGEQAVNLVNKLNAAGIKSVLQVVGVVVPAQHEANPHIEALGFINKNNPDGEQRLAALYRAGNYLVLPTIADCTPMVFNEANAYGMPVVASNVGGIGSTVKNGINGACFPLADFEEGAVDFIRQTQVSMDVYQTLCQSSFEFYQQQLSWANLLKRFDATLNRLLESRVMS